MSKSRKETSAKDFAMLTPLKELAIAASRSSDFSNLVLPFVANAIDFQKPAIAHCAYQPREATRHAPKVLDS